MENIKNIKKVGCSVTGVHHEFYKDEIKKAQKIGKEQVTTMKKDVGVRIRLKLKHENIVSILVMICIFTFIV